MHFIVTITVLVLWEKEIDLDKCVCGAIRNLQNMFRYHRYFENIQIVVTVPMFYFIEGKLDLDTLICRRLYVTFKTRFVTMVTTKI
jgi:hypothetical protein